MNAKSVNSTQRLCKKQTIPLWKPVKNVVVNSRKQFLIPPSISMEMVFTAPTTNANT
jgi:hypothetical protein